MDTPTVQTACATEPPPVPPTAFGPATTPADEVARLELEQERLENARAAAEKELEAAQGAVKAAQDPAEMRAAHARIAQAQLDLIRADDEIDAVRPALTAARRAAGLYPTYVYIASEDAYYRVGADGRTLGEPLNKTAYKTLLAAATEAHHGTKKDRSVDAPHDLIVVESRITDYSTRAVIVEREQGRRFFNRYVPSSLVPKRGECRGMWKLILNLVGGDLEQARYLVGWLAAPVQAAFRRGEPLRMCSAVALLGPPGTGKDRLFASMTHVYGAQNVKPMQQADLESGFLDELAHSLFAFVNEAVDNHSTFSTRTGNHLKLLVTGDKIREERKYVQAVMRRAQYNLMLASNQEDQPLRLEPGDRRWTILLGERALSKDASGRLVDEDIRALVEEIAALDDYDARGGVGPVPFTPQLAAFAYHLLHLPKHRLVQPHQILDTPAKQRIIAEFLGSLDEFIAALRTDGLGAIIEAWKAQHPALQHTDTYAEGHLWRRREGGMDVVEVEPGRLHLLYTAWHGWTRRRDRVTAPKAFTTRVNREFDGPHRVAHALGGVDKPRVLWGVPWGAANTRKQGMHFAA